MQLTYSSLANRLTVALVLLALPLHFRTEARPPAPPAMVKRVPPVPLDPRTVRLQRFFAKLHCPVIGLADDFVQAADDNLLDWRLLPSIAVVESGGGKQFRNNNILGWGQGLEPFPTIRSGIHEVAFKLGKSALYRDRDVVEKLHLYNPDESYADSVLTVMNRISPAVNLRPVRTLVRRQQQYEYVLN